MLACLIFCYSLANRSKEIRWSLDLRWQKTQEPDGFWGIKQPVVMRKKSDPDYKVNWSDFNSVSRHLVNENAVISDYLEPIKSIKSTLTILSVLFYFFYLFFFFFLRGILTTATVFLHTCSLHFLIVTVVILVIFFECLCS